MGEPVYYLRRCVRSQGLGTYNMGRLWRLIRACTFAVLLDCDLRCQYLTHGRRSIVRRYKTPGPLDLMFYVPVNSFYVMTLSSDFVLLII